MMIGRIIMMEDKACKDCIHVDKTWCEAPCDDCVKSGDMNAFEPKECEDD